MTQPIADPSLRKRKQPVCPGTSEYGYGYRSLPRIDHPRVNAKGYVAEHILVAEKALGGYLPEHAKVHHVNYIRTDNTPSNLVICQDQAYHMLLHARTNALRLCGNPSHRICRRCGKYDDISKMVVHQYYPHPRENAYVH